MATALFDRIVPAGKDAVFPFQMSAASLSTTPTVYKIAGSDGAQTTVGSGVSVVDSGGGLYKIVVAAGSMSSGDMYFGVVAAGAELVRIPMWSFAPTGHIADVLGRFGGSGATMSFGGILSGASNLQGAVDMLGGELGDFSAAGITGSPATAAAAMKILFDEVDGVEETATSILSEVGDVSTKTFSGAGSSSDVASALAEIYSKANATKVSIEGLLGSPAGASMSADIAALKAETASIVADTNELQGDWANGGRLDLIVDELTAQGDANEAKLDTAISAVGVVDGVVDAILVDTAAMQPQIADIQTVTNDLKDGGRLDLLIDELTAQGDTNEGKLDTIDTVVDGIQTDLSNGTDGLGALKTLIDENQTDLNSVLANVATVDTVVDGIQTDLSNGTDGLGALKALIDANQVDLDAVLAAGVSRDSAIATVDTVVDGIQTDLSNGTDGLGALKALIDTVNSDLSNGTDGLGALKALIDTVDAVADATKVVVDAQESKAQADTRQTALIAEHDASQATLATMETKAQADGRQTALVAEHDATQATLGAPAGSSVSADIAAVKAVADTLSLQVNAVLQPMVPATRYSGSAASRIAITIQTIDGATGALDDMDQAGTPAGQMYIKILNGSGSSMTTMFDAPSGGSALSSADASIYSGAVNGYYIMNRVGTGFYQAFLQIAAYDVNSYDVLFYAQDSDPGSAQTFRAMRQMDVRSPVQAQFAGGAF